MFTLYFGQFDITVASEIMAILALTTSLEGMQSSCISLSENKPKKR